MEIGATVADQGVQARYCVMVLMSSTKAHSFIISDMIMKIINVVDLF